MRRTLLALAPLVLCSYTATGAGYTLTDSDEPGGPGFMWDDISVTGTAVPFGSVDDAQVTVAVPFAFTYFGTSYSAVSICTNGFLQFGGASISAINSGIPDNAPPNGIVAVFWDDLFLGAGFTVRYETLGMAPTRRFVVSWNNVTDLVTSTSALTFQVALYEGSNTIRMQYQTMTGPAVTSGTVGIENAAGDQGLLYLQNGTPAGNAVGAGLAIQYVGGGGPPPPPPQPTDPDDGPDHTINCSQSAPATRSVAFLALVFLLAGILIRIR